MTSVSTALVADVGGTNTRLALARIEGSRPALSNISIVPTPQGRLDAVIAGFLQRAGVEQVDSCAVAAAGRVNHEPERSWVTLTNTQLTIDSRDLARRTASGRALLMNDLIAVAAALPVLKPAEKLAIGPATETDGGTRLVIGIGTGFGAAAMTADGSLLETEAGHADCAAVGDEERRLFQRLAPSTRLSIEQVLSGPGLARLHEALSGQAAIPSATVISRARGGDTGARKTLTVFSTLAGRVAGNLVLSLGAWGGVSLIGGVLDGLGNDFDARAFRAAFEDKQPFSKALAAVSAWRIVLEQPALVGAACLALEPGREKPA